MPIEINTVTELTNAIVKTLYESNSNTNAFTDAEQTKLTGIESSATADQSDSEIETAYNNQVSTVSQAEAEAGTATTVRRWTAQRVAQAIAALGGGGSSAAEDALTSGTVTANVYRNGGTATTISNPASGEYDLSIKSSAAFRGADVFGNNTTLNGSNEFVLRVDNSANSADRRVLIQVYDRNTGALIDQQGTSTNHNATIAGNITTINFPGMNLFGATGFDIIIR